MPTAELIFEDKQLLEDGLIVEMRIWRVASPVLPSTHMFKYSLFYGRPGEIVVLFDNERGKGDHKHVRGIERGYRFQTPERLIEDFKAAVRAARRKIDEEGK
jgi:Family of unknown function (DUF6516)